MAQPQYIEIKGVSKRYGKHQILTNINLSINYKKIFGIIGLNGSGKTTLLKILIGFIPPDTGDVYFQSRDIFEDLTTINKNFGFATQENSFYNKLTIDENLQYFGKLFGLASEKINANIERILRLVELVNARDVLAEHLSTGMQRRLDIACALIHDPKVLILDEPTEDLDINLRKEILSLIKKINQQGTTIILTSHLLQEVESVCEEIAILHNKTILTQGSLKAIKKRYGRKKKSLEAIFENLTKNV